MTTSIRGFTFKPATIEDVPELVNQIVDAGLKDFDRLGMNPILAVAWFVHEEDCYLFYGPDGSLYGIYGVSDDNFLWVQMTNQVKKNPITAVRFGKALMEYIDRPLLWTTIDLQNTQLIKFVRHLGFKVLRMYPSEPDNYYSLEIVRLWQ